MLLTYYWLMIIIAGIVLFPPGFFHKIFHRKPRGKADAIIQTIFQITIFIIIISTTFTKIIAFQTAKNTLRNIEIVSPYVSDIEYKTLKSDFYCIDSKADYSELASQIDSLMDEYDLP